MISERLVRARVERHTLVLRKLELETMRIASEVPKKGVVEQLVGHNASAIESLSRPDDVRCICRSEEKGTPDFVTAA